MFQAVRPHSGLGKTEHATRKNVAPTPQQATALGQHVKALPVSESPTCSDNKQKHSHWNYSLHRAARLTRTPRPIKMTPSSRTIFSGKNNNEERKTAKQAQLQRQKLLVQEFLFGDHRGLVVSSVAVAELGAATDGKRAYTSQQMCCWEGYPKLEPLAA